MYLSQHLPSYDAYRQRTPLPVAPFA